jgi:hypothetical protein
MPDPDLTELADLADRARSYLRWAMFLLAVMGLILLVDLQLKRQVARLAVDAAIRYGKHPAGQAVRDGRGPAADVAATPDDSSVIGGGGGDAVDGSPAVAEGPDTAGGAKPSRKRGVAQRPPGDEP